jgi:hypothetical protein
MLIRSPTLGLRCGCSFSGERVVTVDGLTPSPKS